MDPFERFFPAPQPKPVPPLDELLRMTAVPPTSSASPAISPVAANVPEAPLVRLEKKLSEIRRVMKKGSPPKHYALGWIRQIMQIFKVVVGTKNGLIPILDAWLLEI